MALASGLSGLLEIGIHLLQEFIRIGAKAPADGHALFRTNIQATAAALALEPIGYDLAVDKTSGFMLAHADAIQAAGTDIVVRHRCRSDDIEAGLQEECPGVVVNILNRHSR